MNWNHLEKPDALAAMQAGRAHRTAESWPTPPDVQPPATVAVVAHCEVCSCPMTLAEVQYTGEILCVDCIEQHHENMREVEAEEARNAR